MSKSFTTYLLTVVALAITVITPVNINAQVLEEIIVTATRRETTLQEVPISIGVYSRDEIDLQGYRHLIDLSKFSPSVQISNGIQEQNIAIRSFSTRGNSLTLQSAAPVFLDGIHFGRMSMIKTAFLDVERVEILKGPQPLHFGMNATAGAFNIQSARPTDTWEGDISAEFGSFNNKEFNAAISGPISDTLGIRLAGVFEGNDGPINDRYAPGTSLPKFNHLGGRASMQWTPQDNLTFFSKIERSRQRNGGEIRMGCLTGAPLTGYGDTPDDVEDDINQRGEFGNQNAVFAEPPIGIGVPAGIIAPEISSGEDCFRGKYGFGAGGAPYIAPPLRQSSDQNSRFAYDGAVDQRELIALFMSADGNPDLPGVGGADHGGDQGFTGKDWIDSWNALLDIEYELPNGATISAETGWAKLDRLAARDSRAAPTVGSFQPKEENYQQFSQFLRIDSPAEGIEMGGGASVEYMASLFYQQAGLEFYNVNWEGSGTRRGLRMNNGWETSKWKAAAWNLTFNFMDDQFALSVGGRYTDIKKNVRIGGFGSQLIFDQRPCADPTDGAYIDPDTDGDGDPLTPVGDFLNVGDSDTGTCPTDEQWIQMDPSLTTPTFARRFNGNQVREDRRVRLDNPQLLTPGADTANLWTTRRYGRRNGVPLNYRGGGVPAVGLTAPNYKANVPEPWNELQNADDYNSQIVLRYTPNALEGNHTFYAKYAEAFKGPVTDTGQGGLPLTFEELAFDPEFVKAYEFGSKGTLMERRLRYDLTVFRNDFTDLQTIGAAIIGNIQDQTSVSLNAGAQRVDGLEFSFQYAATQNLTLNAAGSLLDATFLSFEGDGCGSDERYAAVIDVLANPGNYSAAVGGVAQGLFDDLEADTQAALPSRANVPDLYYQNKTCRLVDTAGFAAGTSNVGKAGTINRTGVIPQDAPDWRFVLGANYVQPVTDSIEAFVNLKGTLSDDYKTGRNAAPAATTFFDRGGDLNVTVGLNSTDGSWRFSAYARNLFERVPSYHPEIDLIQSGLIRTNLTSNSFTSYGIRMEYHYQ